MLSPLCCSPVSEELVFAQNNVTKLFHPARVIKSTFESKKPMYLVQLEDGTQWKLPRSQVFGENDPEFYTCEVILWKWRGEKEEENLN